MDFRISVTLFSQTNIYVEFLYVYINTYVLRRIYNFFSILKDFVWIKGHVPFIRGLTGVRCGDVSSSHSDGFYISRLEFIFSLYKQKM